MPNFPLNRTGLIRSSMPKWIIPRAQMPPLTLSHAIPLCHNVTMSPRNQQDQVQHLRLKLFYP